MSVTRSSSIYLYKRAIPLLDTLYYPIHALIFLTLLIPSDILYVYLLVYCQFPTEPGRVPGIQTTSNEYLLNELFDEQINYV